MLLLFIEGDGQKLFIEQKHRELVDDFINNSEHFGQIVSLMKQLRDLRQQILARIDQCLRRKEYHLHYCPEEQAHKLLLPNEGER